MSKNINNYKEKSSGKLQIYTAQYSHTSMEKKIFAKAL